MRRSIASHSGQNDSFSKGKLSSRTDWEIRLNAPGVRSSCEMPQKDTDCSIGKIAMPPVAYLSSSQSGHHFGPSKAKSVIARTLVVYSTKRAQRGCVRGSFKLDKDYKEASEIESTDVFLCEHDAHISVIVPSVLFPVVLINQIPYWRLVTFWFVLIIKSLVPGINFSDGDSKCAKKVGKRLVVRQSLPEHR